MLKPITRRDFSSIKRFRLICERGLGGGEVRVGQVAPRVVVGRANLGDDDAFWRDLDIADRHCGELVRPAGSC